jgi:phosphoribosyl 1,2-cyclic phosphodiesterase
MSDAHHFAVHFWGVRGSVACPGPDTVRYGGNTSCVEVHAGDEHIILDGGTGLRPLGVRLKERGPVRSAMFFTHAHWDHIQGFPFFAPAYLEGNRLDLYGSVAAHGTTLEAQLTEQMRSPNFPVPIRELGADLRFHDIEAGAVIPVGDVTVTSAPLNHPGGAIGYRVSFGGCNAAYVTDTEHFNDRLDENVLRLAADADLLIYDATYTDEEYAHPDSPRVGWGHSTWQEAVKVAQAAAVKRLVLFHHEPSHDDRFLDDLAEQVTERFPDALIAREGLSLQLAGGHGLAPV